MSKFRHHNLKVPIFIEKDEVIALIMEEKEGLDLLKSYQHKELGIHTITL